MKLVYSFHFPPDIEDEIFEQAARMFPGYAPTLALVSKRVQVTVEFVIYETIALDWKKVPGFPKWTYAVLFMPTLRSRPAEFFASRVRNLCITSTAPEELIPEIMSKCTGVRNLAIWKDCGPDQDTLSWVLPLSSTLRSISTDRRTLHRLAASGSVFPRMENLNVMTWPSNKDIPSLDSSWLPALATVLVDVGPSWMIDAMAVSTTAKNLSLLVLNPSLTEEEDEDVEKNLEWMGKTEHRTIVAYRHGDFVVDWECFIFDRLE